MSDHDIEQRLRALASAPDDGADWEDVLRRADERHSVPRVLRRRLALAVAAALVVAGSVLGTVVAGGTRPVQKILTISTGPTAPVGPAPFLNFEPPNNTNPWGDNGRQITIDGLRADVPQIPLPNAPSANDGNAGAVWLWKDSASGRVVAASVYYPQAKMELVWSSVGLLYSYSGMKQRTVDGVRAILFSIAYEGSGPTGSPPPPDPLVGLSLPVGPSHAVALDGFVSESDLISIAHTLSPAPADVSPAGDLPPADPQPGPNVTRWDGLLADGVSVSSVGDAAGSLAFEPVVPSSLGDPTAIFETDPAHAPANDRVLSLRYDDASKGRFWLVERPSLSTTESQLSEIVRDCTRCRDWASILALNGDLAALKIASWDNSVRIVWVENGIYYEVTGPLSTFTEADALSVAEAVAAAG
ncbi:MAG: hypothetical protein QOG85_2629 [Gaiellaceae bacterium]|jgi:hypothetical protein|nr:hypothetical protein [Gaiellaceae bacterium]